ncbi:unnamed protein product [Diatraea saccharalis]|uniref:Nose resistant to fluoxetine protein 6 n=1 Tax=Diatraea saccharalis TaxID=40085 RepID=A0A9N9QXY9_9NEOP|nr:unnamed protein product [Diatraea saccharalis]
MLRDGSYVTYALTKKIKIIDLMLYRKSRYTKKSGIEFELAICIPKVCSTEHALRILINDTTVTSGVNEAFCRLPNDKPWVAADYVAIVIFSSIGLLTILSTFYNIRHTVVLKNDSKQASKLYMIFSVYANTRKFFNYRSDVNALNSVEGVRSIAMLWIILLHTFAIQFSFLPANPQDVHEVKLVLVLFFHYKRA